jgi:hypothetical protein
MNNPTEFILCPMIIIFPTTMVSPSTRGRLLQTKSACFFSHAMNQVSKLSEFKQAPANQKLSLVMPGIKSLSCQHKWSLFDDHVQQDRPASKIDLCVWFCIYRHEDMAAL